MPRVLALIAALAWPALLFAPAPWVLPGTNTWVLPSLGYGAAILLPVGVLGVVAGVLGAFGVKPWLTMSLSVALAAWPWGLVIAGSLDRQVQLARQSQQLHAVSDSCRRANTSRRMSDRRAALSSIDLPPDDWAESSACSDLVFETKAFEQTKACPRWLPDDECHCGDQTWPKSAPPCDGGVICARVPGQPYDTTGELRCSS